MPNSSYWLDIICMVAAFSLMETAVTGKLVNHGRGGTRSSWPMPLWLCPIFAIGGFALCAYTLINFVKKRMT